MKNKIIRMSAVFMSWVILFTTLCSTGINAYAADKPTATSISSITAKPAGFTVKYKKVSGVTGYQIQYSTSSKFTKKTTKSVKVTKASTVSKTVSSLNSKKKYYVRVRTYTTSNGKTKYSSWSKAKSITTRDKNEANPTSVKTLAAREFGFKVTWSKISKATGYQIQYSTSSKFEAKKTTTVKIKKNSTTSKTVKNLKAQKKYYVRVRTYRTVKGKTYYSAWSKSESVVTYTNMIYVSAKGSDTKGDGSSKNPYATIYYANSTIKDNSAENPYTIKVSNGTYTDLQKKYAGVIYSGSGYQGVNCKNYVYYEGNINNPEKCIISWDGLAGYKDKDKVLDNYNAKAPFHIGNGVHTSIKGFKIECKNTRYVLHAETSVLKTGTEWSVENCILIWRGTPDVVDTVYPRSVFGTGGCLGEKATIKNCKFYNLDEKLPKNVAMFGSHDNPTHPANVTDGMQITIDSCYFYAQNISETEYCTITVDSKSCTDYTSNSILKVTNCTSNVPIKIISGDHWNVITKKTNLYKA